MYAEERRLQIMDLLKRQKRVDVAELAEKFDASPETIRRDLNEMAQDGFLKRTHGGAIYLGDRKYRPLLPLFPRRDVNREQKNRIARVAAGFIEEGDVLALDNSTTVLCLLDFIPHDLRLTILTYSLQIALEIAAKPDCRWTCIILGGTVNAPNLSSHGVLTSTALGFFQPRKLFMSCAGLTPDGLMTEGSLLEAEIKLELIQCSQQRYLLVDASKWGQVGAVKEGNVADFDCLVTNAGVDRERLTFLKEGKVRLVLDHLDE